MLARELRGRTIEETGDFPSVEALPLDQFRRGKPFGIQPAGFAEGPARELAVRGIDGIRVTSGTRRSHAEADITVVLVPAQAANDAHGQLGGEPLLATGRI